MYYEEIKRIDIKHIDSLCKAFDCEISELFEYIPTPENKNDKTTEKQLCLKGYTQRLNADR